MEALAAIMAFCEAPFEGTLLAPPVSARCGASSTFDHPKKRGGHAAAASMSASSKRQAVSNQPHAPTMEELVATMAFCEAPFEGTLALPVSAARHGASTSDDPHHKQTARHNMSNQNQPAQRKRGTVDGLAIFETIALDF